MPQAQGVTNAPAERVPDSVPFDPELERVVRAWSGLPAALRAGIAAMVAAAGVKP